MWKGQALFFILSVASITLNKDSLKFQSRSKFLPTERWWTEEPKWWRHAHSSWWRWEQTTLSMLVAVVHWVSLCASLSQPSLSQVPWLLYFIWIYCSQFSDIAHRIICDWNELLKFSCIYGPFLQTRLCIFSTFYFFQ